jgi:hypothetical protein
MVGVSGKNITQEHALLKGLSFILIDLSQNSPLNIQLYFRISNDLIAIFFSVIGSL